MSPYNRAPPPPLPQRNLIFMLPIITLWSIRRPCEHCRNAHPQIRAAKTLQNQSIFKKKFWWEHAHRPPSHLKNSLSPSPNHSCMSPRLAVAIEESCKRSVLGAKDCYERPLQVLMALQTAEGHWRVAMTSWPRLTVHVLTDQLPRQGVSEDGPHLDGTGRGRE